MMDIRHNADYFYICGAILYKTLFLKVMKKEDLKKELLVIRSKLDAVRILNGVLVDTALNAYINTAAYAVDLAVFCINQYDETYDEERKADPSRSL